MSWGTRTILARGTAASLIALAALTAPCASNADERPLFISLGEMVKVTSGALSDFEGEITEVNAEAGRLKVSVSIFERQVPVELEFDKVKKI